jgi:hypothetical protein
VLWQAALVDLVEQLLDPSNQARYHDVGCDGLLFTVKCDRGDVESDNVVQVGESHQSIVALPRLSGIRLDPMHDFQLTWPGATIPNKDSPCTDTAIKICNYVAEKLVHRQWGLCSPKCLIDCQVTPPLCLFILPKSVVDDGVTIQRTVSAHRGRKWGVLSPLLLIKRKLKTTHTTDNTHSRGNLSVAPRHCRLSDFTRGEREWLPTLLHTKGTYVRSIIVRAVSAYCSVRHMLPPIVPFLSPPPFSWGGVPSVPLMQLI